jgi:hypothetical protein
LRAVRITFGEIFNSQFHRVPVPAYSTDSRHRKFQVISPLPLFISARQKKSA